MEKFRGVDYYEVEELFTEQERLMRDTARAFVDDQVLPIIRAHHRAGTFPTDLIPKMGAMGFFGANLKGYGCVGVSNVACGLIMQELEWGDSAIRSCASVQGALVMYPIQTFGSEAQRDRWLPALARGEAIGCFGLTEPDHGSDPGGMTTRAIRVRDGFLLNGAIAVDHQRDVSRCRGDLGQARRPGTWFLGGEGNAGVPDLGDGGEVLVPRLRHLRTHL
jgi:glutaryl-CoA dehydrogenase